MSKKGPVSSRSKSTHHKVDPSYEPDFSHEKKANLETITEITQNPIQESNINILSHQENLNSIGLVTPKMIIELENKVNSNFRTLKFLVYLIVFLVILVQGFMLWTIISPNWQSTSLNVQNQSLGTPKSQDFEVKTITDFLSDKAVAELGSNLEVKAKQIKVRDTALCKGELVPSFEIGCGFTVLPSVIGLTEPGIKLKSIRFGGNLNNEDKIDLSIKNFEKGDISKSLGTITGDRLNEKFTLPTFLKDTDGILIRFWLKNESPKLTDITLEYHNVRNLKSYQGVIQNGNLAGKTGYIWQDKNEDGKLNKNLDTEWVCGEKFPGVKPVEISADLSYKIERDENCYKGFKPDNWGNEDGRDMALPAGKWILVVENYEFPFEVGF